MEATIVIINQGRGMYAAQSDDGEFVVFELLDSCEPEMGDVISHSDFYSLGGDTYINLTQEEKMDVFVEDVCGSLDQAKRQCFL